MKNEIILNGVSVESLLIDVRQIISEEVSKISHPKQEKQIFVLDEAAGFLGLSKSTLYRLTSSNDIPFLKRGGRIWFEREQLIAWLKGGRETSNGILK